MRLTKEGIELMKEFEGLRLDAYQDVAGVWTIGHGNTYYEDGSKVKQGDRISKARSEKLFINIVEGFAEGVRGAILQPIGAKPFSALVSFAYNVGLQNFRDSTLLKKVNINPEDPSIRSEFMRWNKAGGKVWDGLTRRRKAEANLYFDE
ncbi:lysozyme [Echinicola strongylocentroti]|uniref:Lysozyme n=1 Tax=Echinicola strongylocentroti TaxID=1795355 RepID=A0A2Z4IMQ8_9BACT|nr:lysozyme [Echinicola strongylocentroti]AWW32185.1 lysozyme [Echinicola strongylocentroti]